MDNKPRNGSFCWHELLTGDTQAAKNFYGRLLGWKAGEKDTGGGPPYAFFENSGDQVGGVRNPFPGETAGKWITYVAVSNIEEVTEAAASLGGSVISPVREWGKMGKGSVIADPSGAQLSLWQAY